MLWYSFTAAFCFALGGLLMKMSAAVTKPWPTAAFLLLFGVGALLQALAMQQNDMGAVYLAVLGAEAMIALLLSVLVLGESFSPARALGVFLVVCGVALLRRV